MSIMIIITKRCKFIFSLNSYLVHSKWFQINFVLYLPVPSMNSNSIPNLELEDKMVKFELATGKYLTKVSAMVY